MTEDNQDVSDKELALALAEGRLIGCALNYVDDLQKGAEPLAELESRNALVESVEEYGRAEIDLFGERRWT